MCVAASATTIRAAGPASLPAPGMKSAPPARCSPLPLSNSLLKKASAPAIASAARNSSASKANKKRDSMSHRASK
jgi:hypothetical protein